MKTDLKIEGMTCDHCARAVRQALEGVSGVETASVDLLLGHATVEHDENVSTDDLEDAVNEEGYTARA